MTKIKTVVILAGGYGTRLSEETIVRPKPMVEIGNRPILWHIMKYYSCFGVTNFIICCGYKGNQIKEYFLNYRLHTSDLKVKLKDNVYEFLNNKADNWSVTMIDTGENSQTGGRLKRALPHVSEDFFHFTYGDGLSDVDLNALSDLHFSAGRVATVTAARPPGRYGSISINEGEVTRFIEKPPGDDLRINGGFFILDRRIDDFIEGDETIFEEATMQQLVSRRQLGAYPHDGFWLAMDTVRDKKVLERYWENGDAPWKVW